MSKLDKGFIQVYTGNGKGKTTAAIGQAVRAAGYGLKSYIVQFMKEFPYNEQNSLKHLSEWITMEQFAGDDFVYKKQLPGKKEIDKARRGLAAAKAKMLSGKYDLIILDEVCVSIYFGLFSDEEILTFMKQKPENVELILTGRYCPDNIMDKAEVVTEMKEIKHYYQEGITARKGIES
ncbi:MAG: cob(I)yrinic acid a,c-diamide adenosyltransferase [Ignavibacteria bacterium]|nr:cob(I)yrinic acid a,c-diamide adenosyltransferase [Ignavibacteria bacterium]MBT8385905.1 cob(I)yrinic acid a,c-diamide adenosyltransferase [Ignavibacteria bacterium]